jgi:quercetin dioxygenase-like cupin family protein
MKRVRIVIYGLLLVLCLSGGASAADKNGYEVDVLAKTTKSWNDAALLEYPEGQPEITILRLTIAPGAELPLHKHPVINAGVLLRGELTVKTENDKVLHLKAGESIVEVVDTWHYGKNEGDVEAEIIIFYAGTLDLPITEYKEK